MGQKVNPHGMRVGVIKNWDSRWYASKEYFGDTLVSDYQIRKYLKKALQDAGIPKIEIERDARRVRVFIHCAKPGMVIGKGGSEIDNYKKELEKMTGMPVSLKVVEIRQPDLNAQLVAENVCAQLERRTSFRRAMKMGLYEGVNLSLAYCDDCGYQQLEMDVCPKCGSTNLTKIDRMNGYLSYSRVKGDTRLNDAKMAEIAERKSM